MNGYSFECEKPFFLFLKKHHCPICADKLLIKIVSKTISSKSPLAKRYDFDVADVTVKGNMNFTHIEFYCRQCNKYYTVTEAKTANF